MADQEVVADVFCVTAGLVGKQPIGFNSWRTMTDKTEGRDKFAKVMQYGSRFWAWYLLSANNKSEVGQKFYKLYLLTQLSRKCFRVMKVINEVDKLNDTLKKKNEMEPWLLTVNVLKHLGISAFWIFDNMVYFNEANMSPLERATALKYEARGWFISSIAGIVSFVTDMTLNCNRRSTLLNQLDGEANHERRLCLEAQIEKLSRMQFKNFLLLIKSTCDMLCSANMPGLCIPEKVWGKKFNDGVVGLLGVVSGTATCLTLWPDRPLAAAAVPVALVGAHAAGHAKAA
mmetsp:Transcript_49072/g.71687  ORF Transcript_49072/g.71687 Transcript_49072/m.71687 type:complete len:287 (+) Transcript_49072:263-1123(+)